MERGRRRARGDVGGRPDPSRRVLEGRRHPPHDGSRGACRAVGSGDGRATVPPRGPRLRRRVEPRHRPRRYPRNHRRRQGRGRAVERPRRRRARARRPGRTALLRGLHPVGHAPGAGHRRRGTGLRGFHHRRPHLRGPPLRATRQLGGVLRGRAPGRRGAHVLRASLRKAGDPGRSDGRTAAPDRAPHTRALARLQRRRLAAPHREWGGRGRVEQRHRLPRPSLEPRRLRAQRALRAQRPARALQRRRRYRTPVGRAQRGAAGGHPDRRGGRLGSGGSLWTLRCQRRRQLGRTGLGHRRHALPAVAAAHPVLRSGPAGQGTGRARRAAALGAGSGPHSGARARATSPCGWRTVAVAWERCS